MTTQFRGRVGRRIVTIDGPNPIPSIEAALAIYAAVRAHVHPGKSVSTGAYTVSVQRAVRGPRP